MDKKGQIAIFVIIALVIVGVIIVVFAYPKIKNFVAPGELAPSSYLQDCIQPEVTTAVELLAKQGGDEVPVGYIDYLGTKIKYVCYNSGYYQTCAVQQPMLMSHFSGELRRMLTPKIETCAKNLIAEYERRGYTVSSSEISSKVVMAPGSIKIEFDAPMTITQADTTRTFDKFDVVVESSIYNLLSTATSIIDYEATYGDSETTLYLQYFPNLKIEKIKLEDGVKIYKLTDVVTNEAFQFATRSMVWPAGLGL